MKVIKGETPPKSPNDPNDVFKGECLCCKQKLQVLRTQITAIPKVFGALGKPYSSFSSMDNVPYVECPNCHIKVYVTLFKRRSD